MIDLFSSQIFVGSRSVESGSNNNHSARQRSGVCDVVHFVMPPRKIPFLARQARLAPLTSLLHHYVVRRTVGPTALTLRATFSLVYVLKYDVKLSLSRIFAMYPIIVGTFTQLSTSPCRPSLLVKVRYASQLEKGEIRRSHHREMLAMVLPCY